MYELTLTIPGLPKTYNSLRGEKWQYAREKQLWFSRIQKAFFVHNLKMPPKPLPKCGIIFTLGSCRERDYDNLVSSFKIITDCLIRHGIIKDDNPQVIGQPTYLWQKAPRNEGFVKIEITEIKEVS